MPIQNASDSQKVDYLWKKIAYGATKTDIAGNIDATQEPFPSPLQIRADKILTDSAQIPAVIPGSNTSVATVYTTSLPIECTSDSGIATPTLTWLTGQTFWIPPEFGSTYQVKVYISPSGQAGNVLTKGTQVFATGSGNNDLWVFDYQSGILNFNSNNTPYNASNQPISFTGNSVYISGAVYAGAFGIPSTSNIGNLILGNITFSGNTISSNQTNGNIMISAPGTGIVQFVGQDAIGLPAGTDSTRPTGPYVGYIRFNTDRSDIEYWNGTTWSTPGAGVISSDTINPDGSANTYTLSSNSSTLGVMVSINGTLQQPTTAYTIINNNQIQFTEVPLTTDIIEVRHIVPGTQTISAEALSFGTTRVELDSANVNVTGNLLPSANVIYDLGSSTLRWRTGYFSANTINIGGGTIGLHDTLGFTFTTPGGTPQYMMPNGASTSNTFISSTVIMQGNLAVAGNATVTGNVIFGSNISIPVTKQIAIGNIILRDNGDGKLHARDITDNSDAVIVATISAPSVTQGNIQIGTNHIESTNANGPISLRPNGTGVIVFASNVISAGKGGAELTIATGLPMPAEYGVTYANANILLSPGRDGLYGGNVRVTQTTVAVSSSTGAFQVVGGMGVGGSAFFGANVTIAGNLFVNGNITVFNTNNLSINDSLIYLADDNPADLLDIGFVSAFTDAVRYQHTGLVRDASDGVWKLFANVVPEPTTTIDFTNATYSNILVGNILSRQITITGLNSAGFINTSGNVSAAVYSGGQVAVSGLINTAGNVIAAQGSFGSINSTGFINTSGNVSASSILAGSINATGNILSTGAVLNALTINGTTNTRDLVPTASNTYSLGSTTNWFSTTYSTAVQAQYADLAENYVADHNYVPGTVVDFGGIHEVTISETDMSTAVAGVVSSNPAYLMNSTQQGTHVVAVALQGRVQTRVTGPIRKGNMLVSAGDGTARAELFPHVGTVLGKALEDFNGEYGTIEIVVGVR